MPFTIQSNDLAGVPARQSVWYSTDIDILVAALAGTGVLTGCAVTAQGSPDMTLAVASGTIQPSAGVAAVTVTAGNVTITTAHATLPRIDLVTASAAGVKTVTAGTAAVEPKPPDLPSGHIGLAMVDVPAADTAIQTAQITSKLALVVAGAAAGLPMGLTGAVSPTRYVGGTASVAPTTGTFAVGDFVTTAAGGIYICTAAGSPGTWVAVSGGGGGAPTTATYVTTAADGTLSAEVVHPELADLNPGTPTNIDMSAASTGTGVTAAVTGGLYDITFTNAALQYWDVASAIGTGDFDLRMRVIDAHMRSNDAAIQPLFYLLATDAARGSSYSLVRIAARGNGTGLAIGLGPWAAAYVNGINVGNGSGPIKFPCILRIKRVGTTVTVYVSCDEGLTWTTLGSGTSATNIGRIGAYMVVSGGTGEAVVHWVRTYA